MNRKLTKLIMTIIVAVMGLFLCGSRPLKSKFSDAAPSVLTAQSIKDDFSRTDIYSDLDKVNPLWLIEISSNN